MKKIFFLVLLFISVTSYGQSTLSGKTKSTNEDLFGVTIWLENLETGYKVGVASDFNSDYIFENIPNGKYLIKASFIGMSDFQTEVLIDGPKLYDIIMIESTTLLNEVVVKTLAVRETETAVLNTLRKSYVVSDGLSSEFIKKTPDRNISSALKRVSGVTIQNDKFVLVRGLADRYNLALLNGNRLPSTEPDRRAFSFDIIPTSLIDNIIITKGSTANLPGDFGGGIVQINTKEAGSNFFDISLGTSYGNLTTGKSFLSPRIIKFPKNFPTTYNYRVGNFSERKIYTSLIQTPIPNELTSIPNLNGSLTYGYSDNGWNVLFSTTTSNNYSIYNTERTDYQSSTELAYKYYDRNYINSKSLNGLLNVTHLGKNRFSWRTIGNLLDESSLLTREGENYDNLQTLSTSASSSTKKLVLNSQIDYFLQDWKFNIGYNLMLRNQPDYRIIPTASYLNSNEPLEMVWKDTYRFWSDMTENQFNGNVSREIGKFEIGGGYVKTLRDFSARVFRYNSFDLMDEITNNTDKYSADFNLSNGYVMYQTQNDKIQFNTGLRTEWNNFIVKTSDFSGSPVNVVRDYLNVLPSLNLSYITSEKIKYRFSLSKTLARPEFREVANFAYYDFVRNAQILGNTKLEKTDIYNLDLKWELYPKVGENVSISLFSKQFQKPIEQIVASGSVPSNLILTYTNPNSALVYGVELELRKTLCNWIDVYTNSSFINSEVKVDGIKRQLQGQSNYVINGGINFHKESNQFTISYNRIGDRISAVGFQGYSDIYENSRDVIDLVLSHKLSKGNIKFSVNDLLQQPSVFYQKPNVELIKLQNETNISLTLNLNF